MRGTDPYLAGAVAVLALAFVVASGGARAEPLRIGHDTWVAAGPLYIAREKGYFAGQGVEVELINIEDAAARAAALAGGDLDAMTATVDRVPLIVKADVSLVYLFALSDSKGADGIVASRDIKVVADLKGKKVAFAESTTAQFYLNVLLRQAGLRQDDVITVNLRPGNASRAFARGEVDAAFTWQPYLAQAAKSDGGHILVDSAATPGLIVHTIVATTLATERRRDEFRAFYRAWLQAVEFVRDNAEEADVIMARGIGRWLKSPKVFSEMRTGIVYYDETINRAFFGTPSAPGELAATVQSAIDIWSGFGRMQTKVMASELIDHGVVHE